MKPLHFRLISLIFLLIGANIEALQSEQNDRNNFVINDDIAGETEEDYEDQLKQEASNETFSVLDTFKEGRKRKLLNILCTVVEGVPLICCF